MWHKKDLKDVGFLSSIVFVAGTFEWIQHSLVSWDFAALWLVLSVFLVVPKQLLSYAAERDDRQVVLKESPLSRDVVINRNDISAVEIYEVDRKPIGLKIVCKDDSILTFVPLRFDVALLERIRSFVLERKI